MYTTIKQSGMHSKCNSQTAEQNYSISSNPFAQDYSYRQNILAQVVIIHETDLKDILSFTGYVMGILWLHNLTTQLPQPTLQHL